MPKNRWKDIERSEKNTPEGKRIFKDLKTECMDRYMNSPKNFYTDEAQSVADLEYGMEQIS